MTSLSILAPQSLDDALAHGLERAEFDRLTRHLGRCPNLVELGIVSAMWSEHCSYKSSKALLATLPTDGTQVIQGPGENAGVVAIGDGQAAVFKMESHNHPSFIEPRQGAATGVGGILRDIFTMGARPIAILDALRFGDIAHAKTPGLVAGVVAGISSYGNCVGVPTVGGETNFDPGYNGNILVNVMAVGLVDIDRIFRARGARPGLRVLYVGARTGRDGIHGAAMASAQFSADDDGANRPRVQVGDPFMEKLLIEACLELMATDAIVCVQDMGAAGLTSSAVEMADKAGVGIELDLDRVPLREPSMNAYEIMLSESQERMLMVLKPGGEDAARDIFAKWDLNAETIGRITDSGRLHLNHGGQLVCNLPISPLVADAPVLDHDACAAVKPPVRTPRLDGTATEILAALMTSPDMCSKRWIWEQYDRHVMGDTISLPGHCTDAAIVRVHGTNKALAMTSDCVPRYVAADPVAGGMQAVAEAYRNLSAVGATPLAITNNLNFGAPGNPSVMGQLKGAVAGMAEACRALEFPVVSGNVSLNNDTDGHPIPPTPVIGGLGLIEDVRFLSALSGPQTGDTLLLIGETSGHLGASLYARLACHRDEGIPPPVDLMAEKRLGAIIRTAARDRLAHAIHDVSDGGIACALADMALAAGIGVTVDIPQNADPHAFLFGEEQARCLLAVAPGGEHALRTLAADMPTAHIGTFGGAHITLAGSRLELLDLRAAHENVLPDLMALNGRYAPSHGANTPNDL